MDQLPAIATWRVALFDAASNLLNSMALFIPNLLGAIILFLVGLLLARWLKALIVKLLGGLNISKLFKDTAVDKFLQKAELSTKVEQVLGETVRFLTILIFFVASVNLLGLNTVTLVLNNILAYLPNVFAAVFIIALGVIIAGVVERLVKGALGTVDVHISRLLAKLSSYIIVIFTVLAALSQLKIATTFVTTLFTGFVAMLALGFGLAIGLGSKDLVKDLLEDWYKNFQKQIK